MIADTKFEFGLLNGTLIWIDEALTPDSSRFWPLYGYEPGRTQPSFDKQFLRNWLLKQPWDKTPPPRPCRTIWSAIPPNATLKRTGCSPGRSWA